MGIPALAWGWLIFSRWGLALLHVALRHAEGTMWWLALCFLATGTTVLLGFGLRCVFRTPLSAYLLCCFVCLLFLGGSTCQCMA